MKRDWTILIDTREQKPLPFPSHLPVWDEESGRPTTITLTLRKQKLDTADYALEGNSSCLIETKRGALELAQNLFSPDRPRFLAALDRLASAARHPVVLIEGSPHEILSTPNKHWHGPPSLLLDRLITDLTCRKITPLWIPGDTMNHRRAAATTAALLLIRASLAPA